MPRPAKRPGNERRAPAVRPIDAIACKLAMARRPKLRGPVMEIGVFSVSDITQDPTTGRMPTERERIKAMVAIAHKVEEIGMDVFAIGEHHNPPFFSSSPTTLLG